MNANELAEGINSPHNACCYRDKCRQQQAEIEALKENMCKAIYEEAAYCYDTGDYMLDYSDCQEIIRGTWVRPLYAGQEDSAILRKVNRK